MNARFEKKWAKLAAAENRLYAQKYTVFCSLLPPPYRSLFPEKFAFGESQKSIQWRQNELSQWHVFAMRSVENGQRFAIPILPEFCVKLNCLNNILIFPDFLSKSIIFKPFFSQVKSVEFQQNSTEREIFKVCSYVSSPLNVLHVTLVKFAVLFQKWSIIETCS